MATEALTFINAIIGFCTRMTTWPHPLANLGYIACGVEREITVELSGQSRIVVVDLICASPPLDHAICAETKSKIVHLTQAQKYRAMRSRDLVNLANLPAELPPGALSHDVIYVAAQENTSAIASQLRDAGMPFPILGCEPTLFKLYEGTISNQTLNDALESGIVIDPKLHVWPMTFVPFTSQSPDADIVQSLAQHMASFLLYGKDFSIDDLIERMTPNWRWFGDEELLRLKRRIAGLVNSAMKLELSDYIRRPSASQKWEARQESLKPPHQTLRLAEQMETFVDRFKKAVPVQTGLEGEFARLREE